MALGCLLWVLVVQRLPVFLVLQRLPMLLVVQRVLLVRLLRSLLGAMVAFEVRAMV